MADKQQALFGDVFRGRRVLITGHTGFKGSWLCHWLDQLGASVTGLSIDIPTEPAHFEVSGLAGALADHRGDVRDSDALADLVAQARPDFVFHLAAQALVKRSYEDPVGTLSTNVLGTANVLDAVRRADRPCVLVCITSDKCYDNVEWIWGYRETDRLGGADPYSASKGAAELAIRSFVDSYLRGDSPVRVGVGRAGNVIGGGDWAADRLVPDCMRSWADGRQVEIRRPEATRPWQHVLEPLSGYLLLAQRLHEDAALHGEAFNFGPHGDSINTVRSVLDALSHNFEQASWHDVSAGEHAPEAGLLKLNCDKALAHLGWRATLDFDETIAMTAHWYRRYYGEGGDMRGFTREQVHRYTALASERGACWTR